MSVRVRCFIAIGRNNLDNGKRTYLTGQARNPSENIGRIGEPGHGARAAEYPMRARWLAGARYKFCRLLPSADFAAAYFESKPPTNAFFLRYVHADRVPPTCRVTARAAAASPNFKCRRTPAYREVTLTNVSDTILDVIYRDRDRNSKSFRDRKRKSRAPSSVCVYLVLAAAAQTANSPSYDNDPGDRSKFKRGCASLSYIMTAATHQRAQVRAPPPAISGSFLRLKVGSHGGQIGVCVNDSDCPLWADARVEHITSNRKRRRRGAHPTPIRGGFYWFCIEPSETLQGRYTSRASVPFVPPACGLESVSAKGIITMIYYISYESKRKCSYHRQLLIANSTICLSTPGVQSWTSRWGKWEYHSEASTSVEVTLMYDLRVAESAQKIFITTACIEESREFRRRRNSSGLQGATATID
ncbi:hypothetical protein EVAR_37599_1 [Eumeta japonica]|uniref:Uncharacterized protein n=1 Tax=Eumeta variegata TaxID=151549 RepID=A0A4C1VM39_EUMVA|nr:hypothetical protein EVAR_37599_1 [Eumeta japonica]